jgi:hypothetical protein
MQAALTGWDTFIVMVPLFGFLAFWMFGLDERVAAPRTRMARRRFCQPDWRGGQGACSDPDGKPWRNRPAAIERSRNASGAVEILPPGPSCRQPERNALYLAS